MRPPTPKRKPRRSQLASFPADLFKQTRTFDPVFDKRIAILDADFTILRDFVSRFQAGTWPTAAAPSCPFSECWQHKTCATLLPT